MTVSTKCAPPNSLVLVMDAGGGKIPLTMNDSLITSTDSCIAIGCLSYIDDETCFTLGTSKDLAIKEKATFECTLKSPNHQIQVCTVSGEVLLEMAVLSNKTNIQIWVNDNTEPDNIMIGVS